MPLNVPDPRRFQVDVRPEPSPFIGGGFTTRGTGGEATLIDIISEGVQIAFRGNPRGGVSIDILPTSLEHPPETIRLFGALYRKVDDW